MGKIISIANQKGGVGKTTTAINLSAYLAKAKKNILIIDIDPQGNTCSGLGINKQNENNSIYEVLIKKIPISKAIYETHIPNLKIIPVNLHLAGAQIELINENNRESILKNALTSVKDDFDYTFIDCPPSLDIITINSLVASNSVLIPLQCEFFALEGLAQLIKTINLLKKFLNPQLEIEGILMTMYDTRTNLSNQIVDEVIGYFKNKVYKTIIPRNVKLAEATSHGEPICSHDPNSIGAKSYKNLAMEILNYG